MIRRRHRRCLLLAIGVMIFNVILLGFQILDSDNLYRSLGLSNLKGSMQETSEPHEVVIEQRKDHIHHVCNNFSHTKYWSNLQPSGTVWTVQGVNYCITPKAGCTFWKRGFRYLGMVNTAVRSKEIKKPSDIDRVWVHYGNKTGIQQTKVHNSSVSDVFSSGRSFMFSRNPYERLWAAYIDKFLLPDYWMTSALDIAHFIRSPTANFGKRCFSDITFEELVSSVVFGPDEMMNEHWKPVHRICSPCHVGFDVVGKMETFNEDAEYIIDKYGLESMNENETKEDRIRNDMDMLIQYNFFLGTLWNYKHIKDCYKVMDVAKRLWFAFQLNGYIHRYVSFPETGLLKLDFHGNPVKVFTAFVDAARSQHTESMKKELMMQKRNMMLNAYRNLPFRTLYILKEVYKYDFLLFGYDDDLDLD